MRARLVAALLALVPLAGTAVAGGALETPLARLVVEDGFPTCDAPVAGFCAFDANLTGDPGDWEVDAYQSFGYVGVAVNGSLVGAPSESATVEGAELHVPHPVFRLATEAWAAEGHRIPLPPGHGVEATEEDVTVRYVGPSTKDAANPVAPREWTYRHMEGEGVGYDRAGPFLQPTGPGRASHSDTALEDVVLACVLVPAAECRPAAGAASEAMLDATPDLRLGFEFYDVEVASDPERLGEDEEAAREAAAAAHARRTRDAPPPSGPRAAPRPPDAPREAQGAEAGPRPTPAGVDPARTGEGGATDVQATRERVAAGPLLGVAAAVAGALALLAAGLYTRLARGAVLRQGARRDILRIVQERPGIRFADLVQEVALTRNAVRYHVGVLVREGLVRAFKVQGRACLGPAGWHPSPGDRVTGLRLDRHPVRRRLLDALRGAPEGLTRREVHDLLADVPRRTRNHTLRLLVENGILREGVDADGAARVRLA